MTQVNRPAGEQKQYEPYSVEECEALYPDDMRAMDEQAQAAYEAFEAWKRNTLAEHPNWSAAPDEMFHALEFAQHQRDEARQRITSLEAALGAIVHNVDGVGRGHRPTVMSAIERARAVLNKQPAPDIYDLERVARAVLHAWDDEDETAIMRAIALLRAWVVDHPQQDARAALDHKQEVTGE